MAERKDPGYGENMQREMEQQKVRQGRMHDYSGVGTEQLRICAKGEAKLMDECNFKFFA